MYSVLPEAEKKMQLWAQAQSPIDEAERSQTEWSTEYFAKWLATSQVGTLGKVPLIVITRAKGGYGDEEDVPALQRENERKQGQAKLLQLSINRKQIIIDSGHNMDLEAPEETAAAIREMVEAVRHHTRLGVTVQSKP